MASTSPHYSADKADRPPNGGPVIGEQTVAARTIAAMGSLSTGERKVARALLGTYPVAGLETVAELASRAEVSSPTVVRFVSRLGFDGYPTFQRALRHEVHARLGSPAEQYAQHSTLPEGGEQLPYLSSAFATVLQATFANTPADAFARATELMGSPRLRVHVVGGRFSHVLSDYLVAHLMLLRPRVFRVPDDEVSRIALVSDMSRDDLLVVFDYRRYDSATVRLASQASAAGSHVLLLTDPWLSPVSDVAEVVLPARVDSPSPFDSLVPALAQVEALVAALTELLGEAGRARVERAETVRAALNAGASHPPVG